MQSLPLSLTTWLDVDTKHIEAATELPAYPNDIVPDVVQKVKLKRAHYSNKYFTFCILYSPE